MRQSNWQSNARGAATTLLQTHGPGSANEAADRAEERFTNIDLGGFAYWKNVENLIRKNQRGDA